MSGHHSFSKLRDQVLSRPGGAQAMAQARVETMNEIRLYERRRSEAMRQIEQTGTSHPDTPAASSTQQQRSGHDRRHGRTRNQIGRPGHSGSSLPRSRPARLPPEAARRPPSQPRPQLMIALAL